MVSAPRAHHATASGGLMEHHAMANGVPKEPLATVSADRRGRATGNGGPKEHRGMASDGQKGGPVMAKAGLRSGRS